MKKQPVLRRTDEGYLRLPYEHAADMREVTLWDETGMRIRFLTRRLECAEVADPSVHHGSDQVFFGATVTYANDEGATHTITILGVDEVDNLQGQVSWVAPVSRALLRSRVGDVVVLQTPAGEQELEVLDVSYPAAEGGNG